MRADHFLAGHERADQRGHDPFDRFHRVAADDGRKPVAAVAIFRFPNLNDGKVQEVMTERPRYINLIVLLRIACDGTQPGRPQGAEHGGRPTPAP